MFVVNPPLSALSDITESFISDKARTASVLNGLKNDPSYEFIGEIILKINVF
jgi:hypothetical protein